MIRSIASFLVLVCCATSLYAQDLPTKDRQVTNQISKSAPSIYKLTAKTGVVYKIQTAIGYVTTIELPSEALKVFVGDQDLFVVEVYGHEVIIKPATDYVDARSNLTIYIQNSRLSFDVSVGAPETADFVLDFRYPQDDVMVENAYKKRIDKKKGELEAEYAERLKKDDERVNLLTQGKFEEALKNGAKIKRLQISKKKDDIEFDLLELLEIGDKNYLRFNIKNHSHSDYSIERLVLAKETFKRTGFGVTRQGFAPINFNENIERTVPRGGYRYGLLSFDKVSLGRDEKFILRLYEKDKNDPIEIVPVPLEG